MLKFAVVINVWSIVISFVLFTSSPIFASYLCSLVINELNTDCPQQADIMEFIELRKVGCNIDLLMEDYVLIIVKEFDYTKAPTIVFSVHLRNFVLPANKDYFVIGSSHYLLNSDIQFDNEAVVFINKVVRKRRNQESTSTSSPLFTDVLVNGHDYPIAVMLLKNNPDLQSNWWETVTLKLTYSKRSKKFTAMQKPVTQEMVSTIKSSVIDMLVYSRHSWKQSTCPFLKFVSRASYTSLPFQIATEFDTPDYQDMSINRCPTSNREYSTYLVFTNYRLGKVIPNEVNDCTGPHWILTERLDGIFQNDLAHSLPTTTLPLPMESTCSKMKVLKRVLSEDVAQDRECAIIESQSLVGDRTVCSCNTGTSFDLTDQAEHELFTVLQHKPKGILADTLVSVCKKPRLHISSETSVGPDLVRDKFTKDWEDTSFLKEMWLQQIHKHQVAFIPTSLFTGERKTWIEYLYNKDHPKTSTLRCRFCNRYLHIGAQSQINIPSLARDEGYYVANYKMMWNRISHHSKSGYHRKAVL